MLQRHMGGLRQYFFALFDELLEKDDQNEYILFYFPHNIEELEHLHSDRWKNTSVMLENQEQIRQHLSGLDLYFCPFGVLWPVPVPLPSVVLLADIQEKFYPQFFRPQDLWARELYFLGSTKMADCVIAISEFTRQTILRYHHVSSEKVKRVYLSVDNLFYDAAHLSRKPEVDLPERFVFYPANPWFHKNHDNLLRALNLLKEQGLVVPAVMTGHDQDHGYPLRARLADYRLVDQVKYLNFVPIEEIMYLHRHADMLVFPSLFEGFGLPVVEAMALGCPVVIANTTSLPELGGDAAEYFDPRDPASIAQSIRKVWSDSELRRDMSARGQILAAQYTPQRMAADHLEVFREAQGRFRLSKYRWDNRVYNPFHRTRTNVKWYIKLSLWKLGRKVQQTQ